MSYSNTDSQEIAKFNAMASNWWDPQGEFKALHQINPLRLRFIEEHTTAHLRPDCGLFGADILDIGCGGGILSEALAQKSANVTGIDMSIEPLQIARSHATTQALKIDYQQITAEEHAKNHHGQYDLITCMEMLEHVPDPNSVIDACSEMLKPGGLLFLSTINKTPKAWLMMILGAEYLTRMVPKGTHDYKKFIRPAELLRATDSSDLITKAITGVHYQPLKDDFYLGPGVDVNYMVCCQKL